MLGSTARGSGIPVTPLGRSVSMPLERSSCVRSNSFRGVRLESPVSGSHPSDSRDSVATNSKPVAEPLIVCTLLSLDPSWQWFAPLFDRIRWQFYGGNPRNWLERKITRPALASWRACWQSIRSADSGHAALVISHDARVTARVAIAARLQRVRIPHVAWGFNFTTLPRGAQRKDDGLGVPGCRPIRRLFEPGTIALL